MRLCYCHSCAREVQAEECQDFELRCPDCSSTSCELVAPPPAPGPPVEPATEPLAGAAGASLGERLNVNLGATLAEHVVRRRRRRAQGRIDARLGDTGVEPRHYSVICDGCRVRDFTGVRHRCLQCADFDLCGACYERRDVIHPGHEFEEIRTPRTTLGPNNMIQTLLVSPDTDITTMRLLRGPARSAVAIIEIGVEVRDEDTEDRSGLDDTQVAWWLADDARLADGSVVAKQEPPWSCPICAEGLEAEGTHGWVVQICGADKDSPSPEEDTLEGRHVYHEGCLRHWLQKRNNCPVCRRSPIIDPSEITSNAASSGPAPVME